MKKKILSLVLCLCILLALIPLTASAVELIYAPAAGKEISSVIVRNVPTPMAGDMPIFSFTVNHAGYWFYHTQPVTWWDKTADKEISSGDTFIEGHRYAVEIWLAANTDQGYGFKVGTNGNPEVYALMDNRVATVYTAYEQSPEEVIALSFDFGICQARHVCSPKLVPQQNATCVMPGFKAYYECGCGKYYQDAAAQNEITDIDGYGIIPALQHIEGGWSYNGTHHYKKCTRCLEVIPGTNAAHSGGTATCLQKATCASCGFAYGSIDSEHRWGPGWDYKDAAGHAWVCADCKGHDAVKPHTPGPAATETSPQTCKDCGYIIAPAKNHTHNLTKVAQVAATCTEEGNIEYYTCSGCSDRFTDAAGKNKISQTMSVSVGALGHAVAEQWQLDMEYHWRTCQLCKKTLDETKMLHEDEDGDKKCDTCEYKLGSKIEQESDEDQKDTSRTSRNRNEQDEDGINWLTVVLVALVCFAIAITTAVIILKKKSQ